MSFLRRLSGLCLRDRVKTSNIWGKHPFLVELSQLRRFRHLVRFPAGRFPLKVFFQAHPTDRKPPGRLITYRRDYISLLAWKHLGFPQEELEGVAGERRMSGFPYLV